tara:strand:+ start:394 stop:1263 length:870 start_codon:yes stop_codon:yes gene_type:complete
MNKKNKKPLGIGLEALIPKYQTDEKIAKNSTHISIELISPNKNQPRNFFSEAGMQELIDSIQENGIIQPLTIRDLNDGTYELISGERRFRAAKELNLSTVPVYIIKVKNDDDMLKLALIENIQRQDLSSIEEAEGYALLKGKFGFSESKISKKVGKNRSTISNKLRLIKLPPDLKNALRSKDVDFTEGHARAVLSLRESKKMKTLFRMIKKKKLSVRETERIVKNKKTQNITKIDKNKNKELMQLENSLITYLATKVSINVNKNKGNLNIHFSNNEDLERIIELILNEN